MDKITLYEHQIKALEETRNHNRVAYYLDMGLGKTFLGSVKLERLNAPYNILVCQKSKVKDWIKHFETFHDLIVIDYTNKNKIPKEIPKASIIIINYDLVWRRPELLKMTDFTLMLDESSYIKNESSKRTKFILRMKPTNVILLSGTPVGGKYEELYSQCKLLGWKITKKAFYENYIKTHRIDIGGFPMEIVTGYKNVEHMKRKLREYGAIFMKSEEVLTLPEKVDIIANIPKTAKYNTFVKDRIVCIDDCKLLGDTSLTYMLYQRQLCGSYNDYKLEKLSELIESTSSRLIIFYNFTAEYEEIKKICKKLNRPVSVVNGSSNDLTAYEKHEDSITLIQYQAGAMGLNLQKANKIVYFTLPLSSELFEQSKKRIHRLGQTDSCFYYYLIVDNSIETDIFNTLKKRQNYTEQLFAKKGELST